MKIIREFKDASGKVVSKETLTTLGARMNGECIMLMTKEAGMICVSPEQPFFKKVLQSGLTVEPETPAPEEAENEA